MAVSAVDFYSGRSGLLAVGGNLDGGDNTTLMLFFDADDEASGWQPVGDNPEVDFGRQTPFLFEIDDHVALVSNSIDTNITYLYEDVSTFVTVNVTANVTVNGTTTEVTSENTTEIITVNTTEVVTETFFTRMFQLSHKTERFVDTERVMLNRNGFGAVKISSKYLSCRGEDEDCCPLTPFESLDPTRKARMVPNLVVDIDINIPVTFDWFTFPQKIAGLEFSRPKTAKPLVSRARSPPFQRPPRTTGGTLLAVTRSRGAGSRLIPGIPSSSWSAQTSPGTAPSKTWTLLPPWTVPEAGTATRTTTFASPSRQSGSPIGKRAGMDSKTFISPVAKCYGCTTDRRCMEMGSDLVAPNSATEDSFVQDVLGSRMEYARPVSPNFYHLGVYQNQKQGLMYLMSGRQL